MPGDEDLADPWGDRPPPTEMFGRDRAPVTPLIEHLEWLVSESG